MTASLPTGYRVVELAQTHSTNSACLEAARRKEGGGLWIMARKQTGGRGSRGRNWESEEGNFFASLLLDTNAPHALLSQLTFVCAIAVRGAIAQFTGDGDQAPRLSLKWPNDVLIEDRKVSGILLESHEFEGRRIVIIGVGVNCVSHPGETSFPATDLAENGVFADPGDFLPVLTQHLDHWLRLWNDGKGFAAIREQWLAFAKGVGNDIEVRLSGRSLEGVFEALDEHGHLILRHRNGHTETISTADIFFTLDATNESLISHG